MSMCVCFCVPTVIQYRKQRCSERPPRQHVAGYSQIVHGNPELATGSGQGCEPGCIYEANVILLGVFGVRHILLHSPPPPLLVLTDESSCLHLSLHPHFHIHPQQIVPTAKNGNPSCISIRIFTLLLFCWKADSPYWHYIEYYPATQHTCLSRSYDILRQSKLLCSNSS